MRVMLALTMLGALAVATSVHAGPDLINTGTLKVKEAQDRFSQAWKECAAVRKPGSSDAAFTACVNKKLAKYKLKMVLK